MGGPKGVTKEGRALTAQLDTLRKAERVLTRDPEITTLISSSDDELLMELRREKAEEAKGKKVDKNKVMEECLNSLMPKNKRSHPAQEKSKPINTDAIPPKPAGNPNAPKNPAPQIQPPKPGMPQAQPSIEPKKSSQNSTLFG